MILWNEMNTYEDFFVVTLYHMLNCILFLKDHSVFLSTLQVKLHDIIPELQDIIPESCG